MSAPATPSTIQFIQMQPMILAGSGASIGDNTLVLSSMVGINGSNIVTSDLGSFAYGTIEPGNGVQEEAILFTGVTQNANGTATLTGVSSIGFSTPYTVTAGIGKTHAGASKFILSNDAGFYNNLILYMNSIAGAGAANASTTVKGIVQAATSGQVASGTAIGSTGAILAVTPDALAASGTYTTTTSLATALAAISANIQKFTVSGTWTMPSGAKVIEAIAIGAGGGGGASDTGGGGGGGAGGAITKVMIDSSLLASSVPITVGTSSAASNGGNSSFGTYVVGKGGLSGTGSGGNVGGAGGAGAIFNTGAGSAPGGVGTYGGGGAGANNVASGAGANGNDITASGGGGGSGQAGSAGVGGTSISGTPASGMPIGGNGGAGGAIGSAGTIGGNYGGGGGGGGAGSHVGGAGAIGFVQVTTYF